MINLTRDDVIAHARYIYRELINRVIAIAPEESEYAIDLAKSWDERLQELAPAGAETAVSEDTLRVLTRLTRTVSDDRLTNDALLEWVDAYPDAVCGLLVASEELVFTSEAVAGNEVVDEPVNNRHPALALAA